MRAGVSRYFQSLPGRARHLAAAGYGPVRDRLRHGRLAKYLRRSQRIPGWTRGDEAVALARAAYELSDGAVLVEIGSFLGCGTVLMAGARRLRGSGKVHCIDPFDGSGDAFSRPHYDTIGRSLPRTLREQFEENLRQAGVRECVEVHVGTATSVGASWKAPIDLLFLDGDQSPEGARLSFEIWSPFLKVGGIIALHNSSDHAYAAGHDGHRRVVVERIRPPEYDGVYCVGTTTFATKRV
jgi:predicted O-methyltransferase YrrM